MSDISISLPEDLQVYVKEQITRAGYGSASEYFLKLVERDRQRGQAKETLDSLLLEGIDSVERQAGIKATDDWWEQERRNLITKHRG
ncbi:MAG: type II toxin-antitoxin system ParD family antitoxin [Cyanobacteria bacterium P01_C01_bin.70]